MPKQTKYVIHFGNYDTPTKHAFTTRRAAQRKAKSLRKTLPFVKTRVKKVGVVGFIRRYKHRYSC